MVEPIAFGSVIFTVTKSLAGFGYTEINCTLDSSVTASTVSANPVPVNAIEESNGYRTPSGSNKARIRIRCPCVKIFMHASFVKSIKFVYISPLGPSVQLIIIPLGQPYSAACCGGVSSTLSSPQSASPQVCIKFNQCPVSCVAVLPSLKGTVAVPR